MRRILGLVLTLCSAPLFASGMTLHIWMAEKATDEFVQIPQLREFLQEQASAYKDGSIFPDSGYTINHPYGEYAHWHKFLNAYFEVIASRCPTLETPACKKAFAHMLGVLSHDIADVNFDRHFVTEVGRQDLGGSTSEAQKYTDPGCDFLAILEHNRGFKIPELNLPTEELIAAFNWGGEVTVSSEEMKKGAGIQKLALAAEPLGSPFTYLFYKGKMPWGSRNYMDARGGVNDTARRIAHAWELAWVRFHRHESAAGVFNSIGGWPYVDFYVDGELLENF